jgi:hypothetical protein
MDLPISFARATLTRLRPTTSTDHGNTSRSYPDTGPAVPGCIVTPASAREDNLSNRTATITQYEVKAPATADIEDDDHLIYRGKTYQIVGEVLYQPSPTGNLDHLTFFMERFNG